jgi:hypothetical protein
MTEQELKEKREEIDRKLDWELSLFMNQAIGIYLRAFTVGTIVEWQDQSDAILKDALAVLKDALAVIKNQLSSLGVVIADKDAELPPIDTYFRSKDYMEGQKDMQDSMTELGYTKTHSLLEGK